KLYEKYDMIYNSDLLIIDDLGSENTAGLDNANLLDVINSRNIDEKPIIYSSNYSLEKIREIYGDRIFSRIRGNCLPIHIFGEDLRVR
ncbi:MAG: ATP-binding protein, partial [Peptoniphilaceae bacterium]|nr:ATP-binding protein [Peptoniphilaceae bacterium]